MAAYTNSAPGMLWRFDLVARSFLAQPGLPLADALPEERITRAFATEGIDFGGSADDQRDVIYTPAVTLWAFLSQMLHAAEQRSCLAAVAREQKKGQVSLFGWRTVLNYPNAKTTTSRRSGRAVPRTESRKPPGYHLSKG